jgi:hypothetical protein
MSSSLPVPSTEVIDAAGGKVSPPATSSPSLRADDSGEPPAMEKSMASTSDDGTVPSQWLWVYVPPW